jgi:uncharacterized membrane protein
MPNQSEQLYREGKQVERAVTIRRTAEELYAAWRDFERLPRFMVHLESVRMIDQRRSHWIARGPAGQRIEWDAQLISDEPGRRIAWETIEEAEVRHAGSARFEPAPGGRGTEVTVTLRYDPPAGGLGTAFARAFGEDPAKQITEDLRHFKQLMEAGELATTEGQPHGSTRRRRAMRVETLLPKSRRADVPTSDMSDVDAESAASARGTA